MPSPFPGMDPFLEAPHIFPDLHDSLISKLKASLNARLSPPYFAQIGRRVWIEVSHRSVGPDVELRRQNGGAPAKHDSKGGVAVATGVRSPPIIIQVPHDELRQTFVEIYDGPEKERLVTSIEVLSPTNKTRGEKAQGLYRRKQKALLNSQVNLVEIDLLRGGKHTTAVPLAYARAKAGTYDYHICVHRFVDLEEFAVYPIQLEQQLPEIIIPLLPDIAPPVVDLQAIFEQCYEESVYLRRIRYAEAVPGPALRPEQDQWVTELLRAKGLRPPAAST